MSTFVWMRILESAPDRYDAGMRLLTAGGIAAVHRRIAEQVAAPGRRVLDVGCGTGGVALACAARGSAVVGVDPHAGMLGVARRKARGVPHGERVEWREVGVAEMEDAFADASFDAATSCLAFSELSFDEQRYALRVLRRLLRPGGLLVIVDEVEPRGAGARALRRLLRAPLAALTYLLTQASTRPVGDPVGLLREAGFEVVARGPAGRGGLVEVVARRPREDAGPEAPLPAPRRPRPRRIS